MFLYVLNGFLYAIVFLVLFRYKVWLKCCTLTLSIFYSTKPSSWKAHQHVVSQAKRKLFTVLQRCVHWRSSELFTVESLSLSLSEYTYHLILVSRSVNFVSFIRFFAYFFRTNRTSTLVLRTLFLSLSFFFPISRSEVYANLTSIHLTSFFFLRSHESKIAESKKGNKRNSHRKFTPFHFVRPTQMPFVCIVCATSI